MTADAIDDVLRKRTDELLALAGVTGTARGLCSGAPCAKVYVVQATPELERSIAGILAGVPFEIEETGDIRAVPRKGSKVR